MRILLTNDDGINAPGLSVLEEIARELSDDIWIAAPEEEQSGKGRAISLTQPVRARKVGARAFAIAGTPSDCVLLAVLDLMPDKPDLVLSGVNRGQNIGEDTSFSGTIAAAMFGMQMGIPSIALSQAQNFRERGSLPWETTLYVPKILAAAIVGRNLAAFGFEGVEPEPALDWLRQLDVGERR